MACLGHVERSNPHNAKYAAMKQFLRSQVCAIVSWACAHVWLWQQAGRGACWSGMRDADRVTERVTHRLRVWHRGAVRASILPGSGTVWRRSNQLSTWRTAHAPHTRTRARVWPTWALPDRTAQVEVAAVRKFGSMAAVEEERQERMRGKLDKRLSRRRAAEAAAQRSQEQEARVAAAIERFTAQHSQQDMADDEAGGRRPIAAAAEPGELGGVAVGGLGVRVVVAPPPPPRHPTPRAHRPRPCGVSLSAQRRWWTAAAANG
jgi:hypothetical protein